MSLGREGVFVNSKSRRSPRFSTKRHLTGVLLTDSASQSNASKGRGPDPHTRISNGRFRISKPPKRLRMSSSRYGHGPVIRPT